MANVCDTGTQTLDVLIISTNNMLQIIAYTNSYTSIKFFTRKHALKSFCGILSFVATFFGYSRKVAMNERMATNEKWLRTKNGHKRNSEFKN